uniref:Putative cold-regulated protein n=1 Tax=Allium sativum TaxID=4682 RepID=H2CLW8_ALLSA|nr:putative cold-regulated protein [Allium sativum]
MASFPQTPIEENNSSTVSSNLLPSANPHSLFPSLVHSISANEKCPNQRKKSSFPNFFFQYRFSTPPSKTDEPRMSQIITSCHLDRHKLLPPYLRRCLQSNCKTMFRSSIAIFLKANR